MVSIIQQFETIQDRLPKKYETESLEIEIKSRLMLYFICVMLLFLSALFFVNLRLQGAEIMSPIIILIVDTIFLIGSLYLLAKGRYHFVVPFIFTVFTISIVSYVIWDDIASRTTGYNNIP